MQYGFYRKNLRRHSGQRVRFSVETGNVVAVISASGKITTSAQRAQQVKTLRDRNGNLIACYSAMEGLMQVATTEDGSQVLSWYAAEAVTENADGTFSTTGEPYKTATYKKTVNASGVRTTTVRRRQKGLPEHVVTRSVNGNIVTITKGTGDDTTARSYQYNHLGQLTQVVDDAGTRTLGYNSYGEQETDSLLAGGVTHLITETRDDMGRSSGYTYAKNGATQ